MSLLHPIAFFTAVLLVAASASADEPAAPAAAAAVAPPAAVSPVQPPYVVPYAVLGAPGPMAPPYFTPGPIAMQRNSDGMRTSAIVLFAAGGAVSAAGVVIFLTTTAHGCALVESVDGGAAAPTRAPAAVDEHLGSARQALNGCNKAGPPLEMGLFFGGLAAAVAGIPLFVIGSKQVPASRALGRLAPTVSVGAGNGSLRWQF